MTVNEALRMARVSVASLVYGVLCACAILVWVLFACFTVPFYCLFRLVKSLQAALVRYYRMGKILASRWDVDRFHAPGTSTIRSHHDPMSYTIRYDMTRRDVERLTT